MTEPRQIVVRDQRQLHAALRARADRLNIARRTIDDLAGLTAGHTERVLAQVPQKRIGMDTLFPLIWALGARIVIEDDPENLQRIAEFVNGRVSKKISACRASMKMKTQATLTKIASKLVKKGRSDLGRLGGDARKRKLSGRRRSAIARHAANVRHKRERATRAASRCAPAAHDGTSHDGTSRPRLRASILGAP